MTTDCGRCPLRALRAFEPMDEREVDFMRGFKSGEMTIAPGAIILHQGSDSAHLFTVLDGFGMRTKLLSDGRRQVINFVMKGDFLGLQAEMLGEMAHSVEAVTAMRLCVFSRARIWELFSSAPSRAYDLTWTASREESLLGDRLVSVGQMSGEERVAHGLATLYRRGTALELLDDEGRMPLPFRQRDFADALGLSLVHTNKILRRLRERQIAIWREGLLTVLDEGALHAEALIEEEEERQRPLI